MIRHIKRLLSNSRQTDDASLEAARQRMLSRDLIDRGITSQQVLACMARVPRERFVDAAQHDQAYVDNALPIDCGQTISQPFMVALMSEALDVSPEHRVLEIGTGSGYQTAVLAELARDVVTIERHAPLSRGAQRVLADLGYENIEFVVGDGSLGWPARAPYDRILVTAAAAAPPPALLAQLAEGGLLVAPVGARSDQRLTVFKKRGEQLEQNVLTGCRFVPLVGEQGFDAEGE